MRGTAGPGLAMRGPAMCGTAKQARHCWAWRGPARLSKARLAGLGKAGVARLGAAQSGVAMLGLAGQCEARQGFLPRARGGVERRA